MNKRLRTRKKTEPRVRKAAPRTLKEERDQLAEECSQVAADVKKLECYIVGAPRMSLEYRLNHRDLVPPPELPAAPDMPVPIANDEDYGLVEDRRLSYGQRQRVRRAHHRNLAIFLLLLCTAAIALILLTVHFLH